MPRQDSRDFNHLRTQVIVVIERCLASAEYREIVSCFFVFQEMGEEPRRTQYPVKEWQVKGQPV